MTLSPRQLEIVVLVGRDGFSYKAIARKLGIGYGTVKAHVAVISAKIGATRRPREAIVEYYCTADMNDNGGESRK